MLLAQSETTLRIGHTLQISDQRKPTHKTSYTAIQRLDQLIHSYKVQLMTCMLSMEANKLRLTQTQQQLQIKVHELRLLRRQMALRTLTSQQTQTTSTRSIPD